MLKTKTTMPSFRSVSLLLLFSWVFLVPLLQVQAYWWSSSSGSQKDETEEAKQPQKPAPVKQQQPPDAPVEYGVDISFPMHHAPVSTNYAWLPHNQQSDIPIPDEYKDMPVQPLGDMQSKYENYVQGCVDYYNNQGNHKGERCLTNEKDRLAMSLRQPQSVYNYTQMGYTKIRAPDHVFQLLKEFWDKNKEKESLERWAPGNVYT